MCNHLVIIFRKAIATFLFLLAFSIAYSADIHGRVLCGYQGWFRTPNDGSNLGWKHYTQGKFFSPGSCAIDLWPDVSEIPKSSRVKVDFFNTQGQACDVFSSVNNDVISTHFDWMVKYGIDGIFIQRFLATTKDPKMRNSIDSLLMKVIREAKRKNRSWGLMYDLSGVRTNESNLLIQDFEHLLSIPEFRSSLNDSNYLTINEKPIIAIWGIGFSDRPTLNDDWIKIIKFFKNTNQELRMSVMLGVPTYWRSLSRDTAKNPELLNILSSVDIISPWSVGRFRNYQETINYTSQTLSDDFLWCEQRNLFLLPVVFPGFSWHNLSLSRGLSSPSNMIPRVKGSFFWNQFCEYYKVGARSFFVAMFDELDEGTAIFKITKNPPVGASPFANERNVPSDRYLKLTGLAQKCLSGNYFPGWREIKPRL